MDELWSFVQSKKQQRSLWQALADVLAAHEDDEIVFINQALPIAALTFGYLHSSDLYTGSLDLYTFFVGVIMVQFRFPGFLSPVVHL